MAILTFSLCCSKLPSNQKTHTLHHQSTRHVSLKSPDIQKNSFISLGESFSRASFLAIVSASLVFASNPALAFKGGGPYGAGVTRGQDLTAKDFSGKTLIKQDFKTSILRQANFKGAKLLGASFFDADLTGADLSDADLRGADFSLANVTKANLSNANLEGALATGNTSFKGSIIQGADFTDVPLREDQREYLCKVADGVNPVTGNATRETLLCE
ncbi:Thylakoid lumenal 15 kDa protein 1, chloroplastic [Capsicum baccatum]|uniref:Thylakoid lumenal 15 kDa protein 1, chloroplastic n=2 Tax=Capsicum TaxID=4071 RepID=A0A1U8H2Z7_CAPAN|nr:Thylakoid lumenal 15 kDa protein 1, chloroplastic [Capsicum baccatum]PHT80235.1 Thylakoid lumenal 15 kDa protein 1, chloroplastic [Capsicum annuum]PHU16129.1 Thylakoid lumenal 15 kDa protein 1, chloroplastic [Capsicum chinense]